MRDVLESLAAGELTAREAESRLRGYVTGDAGRYDAARWERRGIPEGIVGEGKEPAEAAELADASVETTGYALVTRADAPTREAVVERLTASHAGLTLDRDDRGRLVAGWTDDRPTLAARAAVVTGGTADAVPAREASAVLRAVGAEVDRIEDVGVAALDRLLDQLERIESADVVVAVAGREGSLPTVLAGLTSRPVIAVPVSSGYGAGGDGDAALASALQSCTVLTTVNIDAGYVAGAQAALVCRLVADERG